MDVDQMADAILASDYNQKWLRLGAYACQQLAEAVSDAAIKEGQ